MLSIEENLLTFKNIRLKLLNQAYFERLIKAASDAKIWENHRLMFHQPNVFKEQWLNKAWSKMQQQQRYVFVAFLGEQLIGSSSYYNIHLKHKKMKIGYTWYHPDHWGHGINPVVKYLLLQYAFENLKFNRVSFAVDSINSRSQAALKKLRIPFEGLLKKDMVRPDGSLRDSAIYAVTAEEWPKIKQYITNHYLQAYDEKIN